MPFINRSPLNYKVNTQNAIRIFEYPRAPTNADYKQFQVGDEWWDTALFNFWKMVYRDATQGIWRMFAPAGVAATLLTPDIGGQVAPDGLNNINLIGAGGLQTVGNPPTNTITIQPAGGGNIVETLTGDIGGAVGPDGTATINTLGGNNITVTGTPLTNTLSFAVTGTTDHAIQIGNATGSLTSLAPATNGQLIIGSTGADPVVGNITSAGGTITITNGAGTINLETAGGVLTQVTAEDATTCAPVAGNLNIVGTATNGINTTAAADTLTISMATPYADGDFEFRNVTAGATRTVSVTHTDNTNATSHANLSIETGGANGGDPFAHFGITGVTEYSWGIDNSDSDYFKFTTGANPSVGTEIMRLEPGGEVYIPSDLKIGNFTTAQDRDLNVEKENIGGPVIIEIRNTDNTDSFSSASLEIVIGGHLAGDAYVSYNQASNFNWTHGFDRDDSGKFKIGYTTPPGPVDPSGITPHMIFTTAGEITMPLQPAFLAYNSATDINQTGDSTNATVDFNTEIYDQNGDFAADTFTAPVTGRYFLSSHVLLSSATVGTGANITIVTSNRSYIQDVQASTINDDNFNYLGLKANALADMDAADTAYITVYVTGGPKTVGIYGAAIPNTCFSGFLAC